MVIIRALELDFFLLPAFHAHGRRSMEAPGNIPRLLLEGGWNDMTAPSHGRPGGPTLVSNVEF